MMGVGKSTLGKIVAKKQGIKFIDTDTNIEKKCLMPVAEIFKKKGDKFFRELVFNCFNEFIYIFIVKY